MKQRTKTKLTPLEVTARKRSWMPGVAVRIHSDHRGSAKTWCKNLVSKELLDKENYHMVIYTNVYEDTFHFLSPLVAQSFAMEFNGKF